MKNLPLNLVLLLGLLIFGCSTPTPQPVSTLVINIANTGHDKLEAFNIEKELHYKLSGEKDSIALNLIDEIILDFEHGWSHSYIHVKPGANLIIDTIASNPIQVGVVGTSSKENEYLASFATVMKSQSKAFSMRAIAKYEPDSFLLQIKQKFETPDQLISKIKNETGVSESFKSAMENRIIAAKGNDLLMYKGWYNYLNKMYPELPEYFYKDISLINFKDPMILIFEEGRQLANAWHSKYLSYDDFDSDSAFYTASLARVNKRYPNSLTGDYCSYEVISDQINFGSGIDGTSKLIEDYRATVTNKYLNNKLDQTIEPWLTLKAGLDAPDFMAINRDGQNVQLSELKGKKVYIDVWATWCGPCVKEIPFLKKLEAELHEENIEFVSVSIDEAQDKDKWLKFIAEKEMKGVQLMADGDWKSDVATSYNIKGIPRFLLIDTEGKILNANAPRPSDPKIKDLLLN